MAYQTTRPLLVLSNGLTRRARQPVAPGEFPPALWAAMLADGTVVEVPDTPLPAKEVEATDAAVKLAEALGLDLADIAGRGEGGRVLVSDVRRAAAEEEE